MRQHSEAMKAYWSQTNSRNQRRTKSQLYMDIINSNGAVKPVDLRDLRNRTHAMQTQC